MRAQIDQALRTAYAVREGKLLAANAVLAALVAVTNGGAVLIATGRNLPEAGEILAQAAITLPLAVVVLLTAIAALVRWIRRDRVLAVHAVALGLSTVALGVWAVQLLLVGVPATGFVWMPGILTAWAVYAAVLAVRFLVRDRSLLFRLPAFVALIAVALDLGVLTRAL